MISEKVIRSLNFTELHMIRKLDIRIVVRTSAKIINRSTILLIPLYYINLIYYFSITKGVFIKGFL